MRLAPLAVLAALAVSVAAQPTVDGDLTDTNYVLLDDNTGGAATGFGVPTNGRNGSVLTAAYAYADPATETLYLGFGGTVEANFNKLLVFLDTRSGGYNNSNYGSAGDGSPTTNFNVGGEFDDAFTADFVLEVTRGNDPIQVFANVVELLGTRDDATESVSRFVYNNGGSGSTIQVAFGNLPDQTSQNTTTIGIEVSIPYSTTSASDAEPLVIAGNTIGLFPIITGQDGKFMSNQTLSPLPAGTNNLGNGPVDFGTLAADPLSYTFTPVSVEDPATSGLTVSALGPNPTAGAARLTVTASEAGPLAVEVYDALGRRVATALDGAVPAGPTTVTVPTAALAPGVYVVHVRGARGTATRLLTVAR